MKPFHLLPLLDTMSILTAMVFSMLTLSSASSASASNQLTDWAAHKNPKLDPYSSNKRGVHMPSLTSSMTIGRNGPVLMSDTALVDSLANLNRERIPERVVHAKGGGAHGVFEVTHDVTRYTKASVFSSIGKKTRTFARFSTAIGESGSPDSVRDNRGFAVKFYTDAGVWNFAGCNIPVFRIRDPILFPAMIHAAKRNPQTNLRNPTAIWDFFSLRPEATFNTLMSYSDIGLPDGFRFMHGHSIHTYKLVNAQGQVHYARFNFISDQGLKNLTEAEALQLKATNPDYSIGDLYNAIARGDYPSWTLYLQVLTLAQVQSASFNVFDLTKILPESEYPFVPVGRLVLNKNPINYFSEVENAAFSPADLVPGFEICELDPILQARCVEQLTVDPNVKESMAYRDAQRHRLGPNFDQLAINRPKESSDDHLLPYSYLRNGPCNEENYGNGPDYFPNSFQGPGVDPGAKESSFSVGGIVDRIESIGEDDYSQATHFLTTLNQLAMDRLIQNLGRSLAKVPASIRDRQIGHYDRVDGTFGANLRSYIAHYA